MGFWTMVFATMFGYVLAGVVLMGLDTGLRFYMQLLLQRQFLKNMKKLQISVESNKYLDGEIPPERLN